MKSIHISILFLFLLASVSSLAQKDVRTSASKADPVPKIEMGSFEEFKLENGLKIIVVENHKLPQVSFQVFIDIPPILEGKHAGVGEMTGQLINKGTSSRSKAQIDKEIDAVGASFSANSNGLHGSVLTKNKTALLEVMSDVLLNPSFPAEEFDQVKKQTLSALAQSKEDPNAIADNVANALRYSKKHPYGEVTTEESIETLTVDMVKKYYRTFFKPDIAYLIVSGDINKMEAKELAKQYFGAWKRGTVMAAYHKRPKKATQTEVNIVDIVQVKKPVMEITYPVVLKPKSDDLIKSSVMNILLDGKYKLRPSHENKISYNRMSSGLFSDKEIGYFTAGGIFSYETIDSVLSKFLADMKRLQDEKVSEKELDLAKKVLTERFNKAIKNPETLAQLALITVRNKLSKDYYPTYLERLNNVTAEDVQAMAQKYLSPNQAYIMVVGNKNEVAEKLTHFSANNRLKYFDVYGNELKEKGR